MKHHFSRLNMIVWTDVALGNRSSAAEVLVVKDKYMPPSFSAGYRIAPWLKRPIAFIVCLFF